MIIIKLYAQSDAAFIFPLAIISSPKRSERTRPSIIPHKILPTWHATLNH